MNISPNVSQAFLPTAQVQEEKGDCCNQCCNGGGTGTCQCGGCYVDDGCCGACMDAITALYDTLEIVLMASFSCLFSPCTGTDCGGCDCGGCDCDGCDCGGCDCGGCDCGGLNC